MIPSFYRDLNPSRLAPNNPSFIPGCIEYFFAFDASLETKEGMEHQKTIFFYTWPSLSTPNTKPLPVAKQTNIVGFALALVFMSQRINQNQPHEIQSVVSDVHRLYIHKITDKCYIAMQFRPPMGFVDYLTPGTSLKHSLYVSRSQIQGIPLSDITDDRIVKSWLVRFAKEFCLFNGSPDFIKKTVGYSGLAYRFQSWFPPILDAFNLSLSVFPDADPTQFYLQYPIPESIKGFDASSQSPHISIKDFQSQGQFPFSRIPSSKDISRYICGFGTVHSNLAPSASTVDIRQLNTFLQYRPLDNRRYFYLQHLLSLIQNQIPLITSTFCLLDQQLVYSPLSLDQTKTLNCFLTCTASILAPVVSKFSYNQGKSVKLGQQLAWLWVPPYSKKYPPKIYSTSSENQASSLKNSLYCFPQFITGPYSSFEWDKSVQSPLIWVKDDIGSPSHPTASSGTNSSIHYSPYRCIIFSWPMFNSGVFSNQKGSKKPESKWHQLTLCFFVKPNVYSKIDYIKLYKTVSNILTPIYQHFPHSIPRPINGVYYFYFNNSNFASKSCLFDSSDPLITSEISQMSRFLLNRFNNMLSQKNFFKRKTNHIVEFLMQTEAFKWYVGKVSGQRYLYLVPPSTPPTIIELDEICTNIAFRHLNQIFTIYD